MWRFNLLKQHRFLDICGALCVLLANLFLAPRKKKASNKTLNIIFVMTLQDELLAELEELEQQDLEESMKNMGGLPSVPSAKLPSARPSHRASKYNAPRT